jgi:DNA helicase-2/ATP-dependent DNA helicase PcrA
MPHPLLDNLNVPQQQAVAHHTGPCLTLAGPGSGKTTVLVRRCAYLVDVYGVDPSALLAVTFTNKAAKEMRERLAAQIGRQRASRIAMGTFHSLCARWLRKEIHLLGRDAGFSIFDEDEQRKVMRGVLEKADLDYKPKEVLEAISSAKMRLLDVREFTQRAEALFANGEIRDLTVAPLYDAYQKALRKQNALDFDDLIMLMVEILRTYPAALERYQQRYQYIAADEYQDTNESLAELLRLLAASHRNLFVVGDDQQSIYRFRGADVGIIRSFEQEYPDATIIKLEQNFRSTGTIVDIAQSIIAPSPENVYNKNLWTTNPAGVPAEIYQAQDAEDEADFVLRTTRALLRQGHRLSDIAVIYRTNAQSRPFEQVFVRANVPYKVVGGTPFYERAEVKDVLAYLRVLANPQDEISLLRIINVPGRGVGDRSIALIRESAAQQDCSVLEIVRALQATDFWNPTSRRTPTLKPAALRGVSKFVSLLDWLTARAERLDMPNLIEQLVERLEFAEYLAKEHGEEAGEERMQNVYELVNVARNYIHLPQHEQLGAFLEEVALMTDADVVADDKDACTFITLHRAKGLEYPIVFLPGVEDGILPHFNSHGNEADLEEERRLFYVGASRAKQRLFITRASRRMVFGETLAHPPSPFLSDIPSELLSAAQER